MRRLITALSWPLAALMGVGVVARLAGLERGTLVVQAMSFYPYAIALASLLAIPLWWGSRRTPAVVATVAILVGSAPIALRGVALQTWDDADGSDVVVVATLNLQYGGADPHQVVELAQQVDLLALQELTPQALAALAAAGLDEELPHRVVDARAGASGSGTWGRHPLEAQDPIAGAFAMPRVHMAHPTRADAVVSVANVHVVPPVAGAVSTWRSELAAIASDPPAAVVLGDFNATLDHQGLRAVLDAGFTDAASTTGQGLAATWPARGSRLPGIAIDHVLFRSNVGVSDVRVVEVEGTDHRAVWARLILPLRT